MKRSLALGLTLLSGVAIGATAIQGLHAQAKPPTYVVVAIRSVSDADSYRPVIEKAPALIKEGGGTFLVRSNDIISLDGTPPKRFVLLQFDSAEKAQAWYNMPGMKELNAIRAKSTDSLAFIVQGVAN
jgi:uncharacterized protein (DUF1330 family)